MVSLEEQRNARFVGWKRLFVISAGFGAGAVVALVVVASATVWFATRPATVRPWDKNAVTAQYADVMLTTGQPVVMTFGYTVENQTGRDYDLPPASSIYKALAGSKSLQQDPTLKWDGGTSIPAGQRIHISIQVAYKYPDGAPKLDDADEVLAWTNRRLAEIEGFVALDQVNRFEIRFPKSPALK